MEKKNPNGIEVTSLVGEKSKIVCVGLNYQSHADRVEYKRADCPILFSKCWVWK